MRKEQLLNLRNGKGIFAAAISLGLVAGGALALDRSLVGGVTPTVIEAKSIPVSDPEIDGVKWGVYKYLYKGAEFRRELKVLKENKDPDYERLREAYERLRKINNGHEYLGNEATEFNPQPGDQFLIDDPSQKKPGVILRQNPTIEINPFTDHTALYNGSAVTIIGEGVDVEGVDPETRIDVAKKFFPVSVLFDSPGFDNVDEARIGDYGFVSMEHLGNKVPIINGK